MNYAQLKSQFLGYPLSNLKAFVVHERPEFAWQDENEFGYQNFLFWIPSSLWITVHGWQLGSISIFIRIWRGRSLFSSWCFHLKRSKTETFENSVQSGVIWKRRPLETHPFNGNTEKGVIQRCYNNKKQLGAKKESKQNIWTYCRK